MVFDLPAHDFNVPDLEWSPDGRFVVTVGVDGMVVLWDAVTGAELARGTGHGSTIWSVTWSPDSRRLATGSLDGSAKVWSVSAEAVEEVMSLSAQSTGTGWAGWRSPRTGSAFSRGPSTLRR